MACNLNFPRSNSNSNPYPTFFWPVNLSKITVLTAFIQNFYGVWHSECKTKQNKTKPATHNLYSFRAKSRALYLM